MEMTEQDRINHSISNERHCDPVPLEKAIANLARIYNHIVKAEPKNYPRLLRMAAWHTCRLGILGCGTAHCLAGWAQLFHDKKLSRYVKEPMPSDVIARVDPVAVHYGHRYIWPASHLFMKTSETPLKILSRIEQILIDHGYEIVEE